jgi:cystathionine beta-lyase
MKTEPLDEILTPGTLFVLTNPYNPVGQSYRRHELEHLAQIIAKHDALVFSDEVHCPLILDQDVKHIPYASVCEDAANHSVVAISASKAFNVTGLKTAQLIIRGQRLKRTFKKYAPFYADGASRLGLTANVAAYTDPASTDWLDQTIEQLRTNYQTLKSHFALHHPEVRVSNNQATYLAWLDVRGLDLGQNPADFLLQHARVAVSDGTNFASPGFIRINFALEPQTLDRALSQITRAIKARQVIKHSVKTLHIAKQDQVLEVVGL